MLASCLLPVHVQVWYSAAWSNATNSAFKTSLTALIQQCEQTQSQPDVVVALLKHWAGPKVTLEEVSGASETPVLATSRVVMSCSVPPANHIYVSAPSV